MKIITYFVLACIILIASASANVGTVYQSSDLPSKGSVSTYIKGSNIPRNPTMEYNQALIYFDSTKTDLFNSKIESLNDSPPTWPWGHSIGGTYHNFGGTKWVEIKPGPSVEEPENSFLNIFSGLEINDISF
jgi:hypothetical protein